MADLDVRAIAFPRLDESHVGYLSSLGSRRTLHDGEMVFKAGEPNVKFFVVTAGAVEIREESSGAPRHVALHEPHHFGGDVRYRVHFDEDGMVTGRCVLIATGAEYRTLEVPGRAGYEGAGLYYAATAPEAQMCCGSDVIVVGGGNSAGQAAMYLSEQSPRVLLVIRDRDLRKSMSSYLVERIRNAGNIEVLTESEMTCFTGNGKLESCTITNRRTGEQRTVMTPAVFTFIGAVPCTAWLPKEIDTDSKGFLKTGPLVADSPYWTARRPPMLLETSRPGVFAAGHVRVGSTKRVSSAVGEGAMAVMFVHAHLTAG